MNAQPEALRLADALETFHNPNDKQAAAELRRLHAENEVMRNVANRGGHIAVAMSRIADLESQRDVLLEALKEAATSLETVGRLAGKSDYLGDAGERIPTYMGRHDEVREYATSRAGVARAAIKAVEEGK